MFDHDALQVVADLMLSPETMNNGIFLHLVGHDGEFDALYKKMMHSKTANVFGRRWALFQWFSVLQKINPIYHYNLHLPSFTVFKKLVKEATDLFVTKALKTFDDDIMEETSQMKDDIAGVRATTNPDMQVTHESTSQPQDDEMESDHNELAMNWLILQ